MHRYLYLAVLFTRRSACYCKVRSTTLYSFNFLFLLECELFVVGGMVFARDVIGVTTFITIYEKLNRLLLSICKLCCFRAFHFLILPLIDCMAVCLLIYAHVLLIIVLL